MFDFLRHSSDEEDPPPLSVVGEGATARGSFDLEEGDLRVDGMLNGDVQTKGHVHVAHGASIQGEIRAGSIRVAGTAKGIICARQSLSVLSSAAVHGILCGEAVTIKKGADFEGGICKNPERVSELKAILSSAETHAMSDLLSSQGRAAFNWPPQPSKLTEKPVSPDNEHLSPAGDGEVAQVTGQGDAIQDPETSSVSSETEDAVVENQSQEDSATAERSEIKW
jgi:cytoskeletal protein CcmA (bactofilin family)